MTETGSVQQHTRGQTVTFVGLLLINAIGLMIIFGGTTYAESTVFGQLANITARTNQLLVLLLINQLVIGMVFRR